MVSGVGRGGASHGAGADYGMFSHTHSAPNAAEEPDYFEMVCRKADRAVREAAGNMKPMEAAWGIGGKHRGDKQEE